MLEDLFVRVEGERLAEQAAAVAAAGAGPEVYFAAERLRRLTARAAADLRRLLAGFPAHTLHAPFVDVWPGAADPAVRALSLETMRRALGLAADLGSRLVVMHYNYDPIYYRQGFAGWLERAAEFYATLLDERDGPLIALENIADPTPYVALQLIARAARPRLVHCFDFGHHQVFGRIPFPEWLFYLSPRGHIHFHLHDNHGGRDDHLALGAGSIDWVEARAAITSLACPFTIALEPKSAATRDASIAYYRTHFLGCREPRSRRRA
ncbi:MAG TPA: sugar phosphate isomerase/epimerase family protein [Candidatus Aminicenantes bacterium]|nr:sugar phosphate isomerase/epimerase family protein [Candidatus Aminicenantes bacterium]